MLGLGSPTWLATQYEMVRRYCDESGLSPWDVMEGLVNGSITLPKTSNIQSRFTNLKVRLEALRQIAGAQLVDALFPSDQAWARSFTSRHQ